MTAGPSMRMFAGLVRRFFRLPPEFREHPMQQSFAFFLAVHIDQQMGRGDFALRAVFAFHRRQRFQPLFELADFLGDFRELVFEFPEGILHEIRVQFEFRVAFGFALDRGFQQPLLHFAKLEHILGGEDVKRRRTAVALLANHPPPPAAAENRRAGKPAKIRPAFLQRREQRNRIEFIGG